MQILVILVVLAAIFLAVGLIVTAVKWLSIIALLFLMLALAQHYRERRR